ncbi:LysR family transcriptional regulator [Bosea robiniae]|nr:LysR family transcriptional regulator [Bosea robiniae]
MRPSLTDLDVFVAIARAGGFRGASRATGESPSGLSERMRRLEDRLGIRLLNRTTRSVALTDAGRDLLSKLEPALREVEAALDVVNGYKERPAGTLRLNVPVSAARLVLPTIVPPFLAAYPDIRLEVIAEDDFVDLLAARCDAGIRYDERLEPDMIALPIGPRVQRFATVASKAYLDRRGTPGEPRDLLQHSCIRVRFPQRALAPWEFERNGQTLLVDPPAVLIVQPGGVADLAIAAAIAGIGIVTIFEDWVRPHLETGALVPVLPEWWLSFSGPFLYYPGRRLVPTPLRAFIDYIKKLPSPI